MSELQADLKWMEDQVTLENNMKDFKKKVTKFIKEHDISENSFFAMYGMTAIYLSGSFKIKVNDVIKEMDRVTGLGENCIIHFLYEFTESEEELS